MPELRPLEDESLEDIDETIGERIMALSEIFPGPVRSAASATGGYAVSGAKWLYNFTGKTLWIVSTSFMILALPVVFEVERVQTEEAQLQQQRQILLGPQAASGGGGMGTLPPGYPPGAR